MQYPYSIWRDDDGCCNVKYAKGSRADCIRWMRKHWKKLGPMMLMNNNTGRLESFVLQSGLTIMYGQTMSQAIEMNLAQARAVMSRPDYDEMPDYAKRWCEQVTREYGDRVL